MEWRMITGEQSSDTKTKQQMSSPISRGPEGRGKHSTEQNTHTHTPQSQGRAPSPTLPGPRLNLLAVLTSHPVVFLNEGPPEKINKEPAEAKIPAQESKSTNSPATQLGGGTLPGLYTSDTHRSTEEHSRRERGAPKSPDQVLSSLPNGISEMLGTCFRYQR